MNGARSIYARKGYLLTALAAAVLLAASPGTASAQSVGFVGTSGSVAENSDDATTTVREGLAVTLEASGLLDANGDRVADPSAVLGKVAIGIGAGVMVYNADGETIAGGGEIANLFAKSDRAVLTVAGSDDPDWKDGQAKLTLTSVGAGVSVPTGTFTVTVLDDDAAPTAKFSKTSISLTEDSTTGVTVGVEAATQKPGVMTLAPSIKIMVSPAAAAAAGADAACPAAGTTGYGTVAVAIKGAAIGAKDAADPDGVYPITLALEGTPTTATNAAALTVTACTDMSGFKDPVVTVAFVPTSLASGTDGADGNIIDGGPLTITVQSDEATPTVGFVPTSLSIDEGGSETAAIYADGPQGAEVGVVTVGVSGDAMVALSGDAVEMMDGAYQVDLGDSANVRFTVVSESDRSLEDGMTKTATLSITDADDADVDRDAGTITVTVVGSTAVPALPLLAQLLLALFLMAGGAKLYRRRQG